MTVRLHLGILALLLASMGCSRSGGGDSPAELRPGATVATQPAPSAAEANPGSSSATPTDTHAEHTDSMGAADEPGLMVAGDPQDVPRQIEEQVAQFPRNKRMRMQAAEFYMNRGKYADAVDHLRVATQLAKDALPWVALGDAYMLLQRFAEAQRCYDRVAKLEPDSVRYIHGQAQLWVARERFKQAGALLERGVIRHPDDIDLRSALGNLYLVVNKPKRAVDTLEPAVKLAPGRADIQLLLGDAHERNLHLNAAIDALREAVRIEPRMSEAWGKLGQNLVNVTRYAEAREPLLKAITIEPMNSYYYWALGDSYLLDRTDPANEEKGLKLYQQALNLDPKNPKALYSYGMALVRRGGKADLTQATVLFRRMLALKEADMNVHYKLYEVEKTRGNAAASAKHLARYRDLFAKGQQQTKRLYQEASFLDNAEIHVELGRKALEAGKPDLAVTEFGLALERRPDLAAARDGLEQARRRGDAQGAKP